MKILFFILLGISVCAASAAEGQKLGMSLKYDVNSGVKDAKWFIIINEKLAFKTTVEFMDYVKTIPPGSEITWAPGCCRWGNEPFLSSQIEMNKLREALNVGKIKFTLVPSG